jgi:hypothetical protein
LHLQTHEPSFHFFIALYYKVLRHYISKTATKKSTQISSVLTSNERANPLIWCKKYILTSCHIGNDEVDIPKICFTIKVDIWKIHFMNDQYTQSHKFHFNNTSNIIKFVWPYDHHHVDITHNISQIMVM